MNAHPRTSSGARLVAVARLGTFLVAGLLGLWLTLDAVLASDRGLDLTDEGLYLLAADPPSRVAAWGTPWGWHTEPLFRLVSGDLARFRTLGAVLLVAASALLAVTAASGRWRMPEHVTGPATRLEMALAGLSGALGGYLFYAGMIRTPSYNWIVVIGTVLAGTGVLLNLPPAKDTMPRAGLALSAFGLFLTIPAKPTTPILFGIALGLLLWRRAGVRVAVRHVLVLSAATSVLVLLAVALRLWPLAFHEPFLAAISMPTPMDEQNLTGALLGYVRLPSTILRSAPNVLVAVAIMLLARRVSPSTLPVPSRRLIAVGATSFIGLVWLVLQALTTAVYEERAGLLNGLIVGRGLFSLEHYLAQAFRVYLSIASLTLALTSVLVLGPKQRRWVVLPLLVGLAVFEAEVHQSVLVGGAGKVRWVLNGTMTAMLMLVALALTALFGSDPTTDDRIHRRQRRPGVLGLVGFLLAIALSASFGSGHGPYRQTALAAAVLVTAALIATMSIGRHKERLAPMLMLVGTLVVVSASITADNWAKPYRIAPIGENTVLTQVGSRDLEIHLDPMTSATIDDLRGAAAASGWRPGDPLLGVVDPWSSTLPWVLGARVPDSLMLTLGSRKDILDWNLTRLDRGAFREAWLLTSIPDEANHEERDRGDDRESPADSVVKIASLLGRDFPSDYVLVYAAPLTVQDPNLRVGLWRPR